MIAPAASSPRSAARDARCPGLVWWASVWSRRPRLSPTNSSTRPWCAAAPGQPSGRFNGASSSKGWARGQVRVSVWVSSWSSTLCDLGIFVDQPAEPVATSDAKVGLGRGRWSDLSGAACCRARWGGVGCNASCTRPGRVRGGAGLTMSIRSSSSRRRVPIHRSAIAFAWGPAPMCAECGCLRW